MVNIGFIFIGVKVFVIKNDVVKFVFISFVCINIGEKVVFSWCIEKYWCFIGWVIIVV